MSWRSITGVRQALFMALTTPQLNYTINDGSTIALPAASIQPFAPWNLGDQPPADPLVCFAISGRGIESKQIPDRHLGMKIWVSASTDSDLVTDLYEAIRARLSPDTDYGDGYVSWSRAAVTGQPTGSNTLSATIRSCREEMVLQPEIEPATIRWWLTAEWSLVAF